MFAYCGNNPENYRDSTGTYYCPTFEFFHREVTHQYGGTFTFYPRRVEDPFDPMGTLVEDFEELVKTPEAIQEADDIADYVTIGQALWDNEVVEIPVGGIRIFLGGRKVIKGVGKWLLPVPGPVDEIWGTVDIIWGFTTIGKGIEQLIIWPEEELS